MHQPNRQSPVFRLYVLSTTPHPLHVKLAALGPMGLSHPNLYLFIVSAHCFWYLFIVPPYLFLLLICMWMQVEIKSFLGQHCSAHCSRGLGLWMGKSFCFGCFLGEYPGNAGPPHSPGTTLTHAGPSTTLSPCPHHTWEVTGVSIPWWIPSSPGSCLELSRLPQLHPAHGMVGHSAAGQCVAWHGITGCGMVSHSMMWCTICNLTPHVTQHGAA